MTCPYDLAAVFCEDYDVPCSVGSVLGGDQKCYAANNLPTSVKPVGIVFDVVNRLALALTDVKKDGRAGSETMLWSSRYCDTPNLENCKDSNTVTISCGVDGRANTDAILASTCNGTTYAANAVNAYQTSNCSADFCQKGKWFLPSMRDLNTIYSVKSVINNSLTLLVSMESSQLKESYYWSSTELNSYYTWLLNMANGGKGNYLKYDYDPYVRPVVKY